MAKAVDIIGQRFGRLLVVERVPHYGTQAQAYWRCSCDCGGGTIVNGYGLRIRGTQSCGCLNRESLIKSTTKHGESHNGSRLYQMWKGIIKRCYNPATKCYKNYGGRGISVCDEWRTNYLAFRDWAAINAYDPNKSKKDQQIERNDNDCEYAPWNCRFATAKEQAQNRRPRKKREQQNV